MAARPGGGEIERMTIRTKFRCDDEGSVVDELDENTSDSRVREQWASGSATWDLMVSKTRDDLLIRCVGQILSINETRSDDGPQDTQIGSWKSIAGTEEATRVVVELNKLFGYLPDDTETCVMAAGPGLGFPVDAPNVATSTFAGIN